MVAETLTHTRTSVHKEDPRDLHYIPDRRLRTDTASRKAANIAEHVAGRKEKAQKPREKDLFVAMHTCAYRAARPNRGRNIPDRERRKWAQRYHCIRDFIVEENLGLAYKMIRRFRGSDVNHDDLVSDALYALTRAVEPFNPWKGYRFSTYACTAIARVLMNRTRQNVKHRRMFPFSQDESFETPRKEDRHTDLYVDRLRRALNKNLGELSDLETRIISKRFPMDREPRRTLLEVGRDVGLSKERVRQIQNNALRKLRRVLEEDPSLQ